MRCFHPPSGKITYLEVEQEHQVLNEIIYENKFDVSGKQVLQAMDTEPDKKFS